MKIIVAHPNKHHVYHLVAGLIASGANVKFITPFFLGGTWLSLLKIFDNRLLAKARGYSDSRIRGDHVVSPLWLKLKKVVSVLMSRDFAAEFDKFVASMVKDGLVEGDVFISLQDYMPESVRAAKLKGLKIWSDQILDNSESARMRIGLAAEQFGYVPPLKSDVANDRILRLADVITVPAYYMKAEMEKRSGVLAKTFVVPYGVDTDKFSCGAAADPTASEIRVIVRANSSRKGALLFLSALKHYASDILSAYPGCSLHFILAITDCP